MLEGSREPSEFLDLDSVGIILQLIKLWIADSKAR